MLVEILSGLMLVAAPPSEPSVSQEDELRAARATYERAQQVYRDSCQERAYGAYDDLCGQLGKQVRQYQLTVDRLEHRAPPKRQPGTTGDTP